MSKYINIHTHSHEHAITLSPSLSLSLSLFPSFSHTQTHTRTQWGRQTNKHFHISTCNLLIYLEYTKQKYQLVCVCVRANVWYVCMWACVYVHICEFVCDYTYVYICVCVSMLSLVNACAMLVFVFCALFIIFRLHSMQFYVVSCYVVFYLLVATKTFLCSLTVPSLSSIVPPSSSIVPSLSSIAINSGSVSNLHFYECRWMFSPYLLLL